MADNLTVFIVDDDELMREMVSGLLIDSFGVEGFAEPAEFFDRIRQVRPDIVLLDVEMPGMDGYALCRTLKASPETAEIPVIFVSGHDTVDARTAGYDAGGEDFICKPFEPEELYRKVNVARRIVEDKRALKEQAGNAQRMALAAMTNMSELGIVLRFLSESFGCANAADLAQAVIDASQQFDLKVAVQIRTADEAFSFSHNGVNIPLEMAVLNQVREFGRIYQFKTRCVFNYGGISLMVNNMPVDDEDRSGRIRDHLAILAEGADARLRNLEIERKNAWRQKALMEALPRFHAAVGDMRDGYRTKNFQMTQLMTEFQDELTASIVALGLYEGQEDRLNALTVRFVGRMAEVQDESFAIVTQLQELVDQLGQVAEE